MQKFKCVKLEWLALGAMLVFGSILAFMTPVYQIPDEPNHLARAYQVSEMTLLSPVRPDKNGRLHLTAGIPAVFWQKKYVENLFEGEGRYTWQDVKVFLSEPLNVNERVERQIDNTGSYTPLVYAPQAFAGFLARSLGGSAGMVYYSMRLGAVLFAAVCIFFAIRLLPVKGPLIFLVAMMPMFLAESASISSDAVVCNGSIFISAYILSLRRKERQLNAREIITLLFMAAAMGLLKQVYGTVMLLYFLLPWQTMRTKKRFIGFGIVLLGVCLAVSCLWLYVSVALRQAAPALSSEADMSLQMELLLNNPLRYVKILTDTFILYAKPYFASFIGILGWLTFKMPLWFYVFYAGALVLTAVCGSLRLVLWQRMLMLAGCLASFLAIETYEYITWTAPGAEAVVGVQGRYFIPLALLLAGALSSRPELKHAKAVACSMGLVSAAVTLLKTAEYFYK